MSPSKRLVAVLSIVLLSACATSSAGNYSVQYKAAGSATETVAFNAAAEKAFKEDANSEERKQAISSIKVFLDSVPPELTLRDHVIGIAEGVAAILVGSVELKAVWKAPSEDAEVLPAIQKATEAARADLAFCPRNEKPAGYAWRCYLVKKAAAATPASTKPGEL